MKNNTTTSRRNFIKKSTLFAVGAGSTIAFPTPTFGNHKSDSEKINVIGPKEGYSSQIGTLVSMMNWMRNTILMPVKGMSVEDLDFLIDDKANSIGAMLWHLAATERFYQIHTFEGKKWGDWSLKDKKEWEIASGLGDKARQKIKGNSLDFYLEKLENTRKNTLQEFAKRDDNWLMKVDEDWFWGPTNNYCKWFHVCEHESNHNGQFKFIKRRLPSSKEE